jgi:hypothetical protein
MVQESKRRQEDIKARKAKEVYLSVCLYVCLSIYMNLIQTKPVINLSGGGKGQV